MSFLIHPDLGPDLKGTHCLKSSEVSTDTTYTATYIADAAVVGGERYEVELYTKDTYREETIPPIENVTIDASNPTFPYATVPSPREVNSALLAGHYSGQLEQRALVRHIIPSDITNIYSAELKFFVGKEGLTLGTTVLTAAPLLRSWDWDDVCWNYYDGTTAWGTAGAKGAADVSGYIGSKSIAAASIVSDWQYMSLTTSYIQGWIDTPANNKGLILYGTTLSGNNAVELGMLEAGIGPSLVLTEKSVYDIKVNWYDGASGTGTLLRSDIIAKENGIGSWNKRDAVLTAPDDAISMTLTITAKRGKEFFVDNIVIKQVTMSTKFYLAPAPTIQDNKGTRRVVTTVKELLTPSSCTAGVLTGTTVLSPSVDGYISNAGGSFVATLLRFGKGAAGVNNYATSLLKFDFATAFPSPPGEITSATFTIFNGASDASSANYAGKLYRSLRAWTTAATATTYDGVNAWGSAVASAVTDKSDDVDTSATTWTNGEATGTKHDHTLDPAMILGMIDGTYTDNGFQYGYSASPGNDNQFYPASQDNATSGYRPYLTIVVPDSSGSVDEGDHYYKVTLLDSSGETTPSPASSACSNDSTKTVNRVTLPVQEGATKRRVYRTKADESSASAYYLVAEIDNNTDTYYDDGLADADLQDIYPPLINTTAERPQFVRQGQANALCFTSNATLTITATGVSPLISTAAADANDGDYFDTSVYLDEGTYTLRLHVRKETTAGKVDVYVDETAVGTGKDFYGASAAYVETITDVKIAGSGYHKIRIVINGKNASSTDYTFNLYGIYLIYTAAY